MSHVSKTAPTLDKQLSRALVFVAILGGCSYFSVTNAQSSSQAWLAPQKVALLHLLTFASWFGCSIWVSLIAVRHELRSLRYGVLSLRSLAD